MKAQQSYKRPEAYKYLQSKGYGRSSAAFYDDVKKGKCVMGSDKTITLAALTNYIDTNLVTGNISVDDPAASETVRLKNELMQQKVAKGEIESRKDDARWMLKDQASLDAATLVGLIYSTINHHLHLGSPQIVLAAGCDSGRSGEIEAAIEALIDTAFNEVASQRLVDIEFIEGDE